MRPKLTKSYEFDLKIFVNIASYSYLINYDLAPKFYMDHGRPKMNNAAVVC